MADERDIMVLDALRDGMRAAAGDIPPPPGSGPTEEEAHAFSLRLQALLYKSHRAPLGHDIIAKALDIAEMLVAKNLAYGNSALEPLRVFSNASPQEQILVRLDDKLSRLARGKGEETEDVYSDIIGYLMLFLIQEDRNPQTNDAEKQPNPRESTHSAQTNDDNVGDEG